MSRSTVRSIVCASALFPCRPRSAHGCGRSCRRGVVDLDRLVAVELHGQLRRRDVPARSRCGRIARARSHRSARQWLCSADPCFQFASDGECDVPQSCATGDYIDCRTAGPVVNGTLPDAIGSLACLSKITRVYALPYSGGALVAACKYTVLAVLASTCDVAFSTISPSQHPRSARHVPRFGRRGFSGYAGLVGTLPSTISALTAVTYMCARQRLSGMSLGTCGTPWPNRSTLHVNVRVRVRVAHSRARARAQEA